jgi:hypothetical protein
MLKYLLPRVEDAQIHPIFIAESARLRWPRTRLELISYGRIVLISVLAVTLGWWFIERLHINFGSTNSTSWQYNLPTLVFLASLVCTLLSSITTVVWTVGCVRRSLQSGQWDEYRTAPLAAESVVNACDVITRMRVWRVSIIEVALRLATSILLVCGMFYGSSTAMSYDPYYLIAIAVVVTIVAGYAFEPLYRMRAITALTIAATLHLRNRIASLLTGFAAVTVIHLLQIGAVTVVWQALFDIPTDNSIGDGAGMAVAVIFAVGSLTTFGVFYLLYWLLRRIALSWAMRLTFAKLPEPLPVP